MEAKGMLIIQYTLVTTSISFFSKLERNQWLRNGALLEDPIHVSQTVVGWVLDDHIFIQRLQLSHNSQVV